MPITSGLLNHTLTLQTLTETADGQGGVTQGWSDVGNFRARISPLSADERFAMGKVSVFPTHKVYCNPMDILEADRLVWGSYVFNILGIKNPSELSHHLEIYVLEVVE